MMREKPFEKCPETLRKALERSPHASYDLILRVSEVGQSQQQQIEDAGFAVRRATRIVPTFAVTGPGDSLMRVLSCSWLIAVEQDQPVHAFYHMH
jgi:hypothetical protein